MSSPDQLVDVVLKASHDAICKRSHDPAADPMWRHCFDLRWFQIQGEAALAAVRPMIEREVRKQIAREIDEAAGKGWMAITGDYFRSISAELAIDIARGGAHDGR